MRPLILITILTLSLTACNDNKKSPDNDKHQTVHDQQSGSDKINLNFAEPVIFDNSLVVLYPLPLENNDEDDSILKRSSYGSSLTYWNIVFYNTVTGEHHLLDKERKMVIYSYDLKRSDSGSAPSVKFENGETSYNQFDNLLLYSITTNDFNADGKLNSEDPTYLFVSDKSGENFKQISPDNLNVSSWQTMGSTNKILLQVTRDSNNDKKFTDQDETTPMVYDLFKEGGSKGIFTTDFKDSLRQTLAKQWPKEK